MKKYILVIGIVFIGCKTKTISPIEAKYDSLSKVYKNRPAWNPDSLVIRQEIELNSGKYYLGTGIVNNYDQNFTFSFYRGYAGYSPLYFSEIAGNAKYIASIKATEYNKAVNWIKNSELQKDSVEYLNSIKVK